MDFDGPDLKFRSRMNALFYSFETTLSEFVNERLDQSSPDYSRQKSTLTNGYFFELLDLGIEVTKSTNEHVPMKELKTYIDNTNIAEARNQHGHANQRYEDWMWYAVAAMCCHPSISKLGLGRDVKSAVIAAENDSLKEPPEEWLRSRVYTIPNNLPQDSDYQETKLIGREKEKAHVIQLLKNKRVSQMSIVAPGGTGKTALIIDVLTTLAEDFDRESEFKAIIYTTLKEEKLTAEGLVDLAEFAKEEIQIKLEELIFEAFGQVFGKDYGSIKECIEDHEDTPLVLCIDNLETVLRDAPELFTSLALELPHAWKVIVTTRMSVEGAQPIPLGKLSPAAAIKLAHTYGAIKQKKDYLRDEARVRELCERMDFNPLAIRLTVDGLDLGLSLEQAMSQTALEITAFSFSNLVENLSEEASLILEVINTDPECDRSTMQHATGFSLDQIQSALKELIGTSLVKRRSDEEPGSTETFSISDSVGRFLLTNPRQIESRLQISERIDRPSYRDRQTKRIFSNHLNHYVDPDLAPAIGEFMEKFSKIDRRRLDHTLISSLLEDAAKLVEVNTNSFDLHFALGQLHNMLKDRMTAIQHYERASDVGEAYQKPKALYAAAWVYNDKSEHEEVLVYVDNILGLLEEPQVSDSFDDFERFKSDVIKTKLYSKCYLKQLEDVLEETRTWSEHDQPLRTVLGEARIVALKRCSEPYTVPFEEKLRLLEEVCDVAIGKSELITYTKDTYTALRDLHYTLTQDRNLSALRREDTGEIVSRILGKAQQILNTLLTADRSRPNVIGDLRDLMERFREVHILENPFKYIEIGSEDTSRDKVSEAGVERASLSESDIVCVVERLTDKGYLFAQDVSDKSKSFFVHIFNCNSRSVTQLSDNLKEGDQIVIHKVGRPRSGGEFPPALEWDYLR